MIMCVLLCYPVSIRIYYQQGVLFLVLHHKLAHFYPTALKGCRGIVFTHGVRVGGRRKKVCPGCISETVRCRKLILGRDIGLGVYPVDTMDYA